MTHEKDIERLKQKGLQSFLSSANIPHPWFTALTHTASSNLEVTTYCALVPVDLIPSLLSGAGGWDMNIGDGGPCIWSTFGDPPTHGYETYGNENGIEPLVLRRKFYNHWPSSVELSQEFRLYHELYEDRKNKQFLISDRDGNESVAARYTDDSMEIRTDLILQFCAVKQMALAIYMNGFAYSLNTLDELGIAPVNTSDAGKLYMSSHHISPYDHFTDDPRKTISRVLGKKYILPGSFPDQNQETDEFYCEFIIDKDPFGNAIRHTCDHNALRNSFGANPEAAPYLTPVIFRAEVLAKYYAEPEKYEVSDGNLRCSGLWSISIDNDLDDYVTVFLGDLGRDLSENERSYWMSFNIPPEGRGISGTNFQRSIRGQFTNPKKADLAFKLEYHLFREAFKKAHGWDFFLDLHDADQYCYRALHTPLTDNGAEFDDQLINLTKLLVDSLNEKMIVKGLTTIESGDQGIKKLAKYFEENGHNDGEDHINFVRQLQKLRSLSAAHRKGKNYNKLIAEMDMPDQGYREVFTGLLMRGKDFIHFLSDVFMLPS